MFRILKKRELTPGVVLMEIDAPLVARKAQAGQFIILRIDEEGERIPLTVADFKRSTGVMTIVFLVVGTTTARLAAMNEGDSLADFVGPLGHPTEIRKYGTVVLVGGGLGIAPIFPVARSMKRAGNRVVSIIGARSRDLLFYVDKMKRASHELLLATDDGTAGTKGFVTTVLQQRLDQGPPPDLVMAVGPVVMMRAVAALTAKYNVKTIVSLNPIMLDGTGMCGVCRVSVGGATKFACVDGPDFDAHQVDFDGLVKRQRIYLDEEKRSMELYRHKCSGGCNHG
jgi:ferredoxin--NADP+ reductase